MSAGLNTQLADKYDLLMNEYERLLTIRELNPSDTSQMDVRDQLVDLRQHLCGLSLALKTGLQHQTVYHRDSECMLKQLLGRSDGVCDNRQLSKTLEELQQTADWVQQIHQLNRELSIAKHHQHNLYVENQAWQSQCLEKQTQVHELETELALVVQQKDGRIAALTASLHDTQRELVLSQERYLAAEAALKEKERNEQDHAALQQYHAVLDGQSTCSDGSEPSGSLATPSKDPARTSISAFNKVHPEFKEQVMNIIKRLVLPKDKQAQELKAEISRLEAELDELKSSITTTAGMHLGTPVDGTAANAFSTPHLAANSGAPGSSLQRQASWQSEDSDVNVAATPAVDVQVISTQLSDAQAELAQARQCILQLQQEAASFAQQRTAVQQQVQHAQEQLQASQIELVAAKEHVRQLQQQLDERNIELHQLASRLDQLEETSKVKDSELHDVSQRLADLQQQLDAKEAELAATARELASLQEKQLLLSEAQTTAAHQSPQQVSADLEALQQQVAQLQAKLVQKEQELGQEKDHHEEVVEEVMQLRQKLSQVHAEKSDLLQQVSMQRQYAEMHEQEKEELDARLQAAQQQCRQLLAEQEAASEEQQHAQQQLAQQRLQLAQLEAQLEEAQHSIQELQQAALSAPAAAVAVVAPRALEAALDAASGDQQAGAAGSESLLLAQSRCEALQQELAEVRLRLATLLEAGSGQCDAELQSLADQQAQASSKDEQWALNHKAHSLHALLATLRSTALCHTKEQQSSSLAEIRTLQAQLESILLSSLDKCKALKSGQPSSKLSQRSSVLASPLLSPRHTHQAPHHTPIVDPAADYFAQGGVLLQEDRHHPFNENFGMHHEYGGGMLDDGAGTASSSRTCSSVSLAHSSSRLGASGPAEDDLLYGLGAWDLPPMEPPPNFDLS